MDLPEFLLARAAESEAQAPYVHLEDCDSIQCDYSGVQLGPCDCGEPPRVLAWCAALRAVVKQYVADRDATVYTPLVHQVRLDRMEYVLRLFVQPFASHPDFDPAWRAERADP